LKELGEEGINLKTPPWGYYHCNYLLGIQDLNIIRTVNSDAQHIQN